MVRPPAAAIRDLLAFGGLGDLEKFCGQRHQKVDFPGLGAVLGETSADKVCFRAKCGPSEVPCVPGARDMAVLGLAGGHFVSWGPVLVRDPTDQKAVLAVTRRQLFGSSEPRSCCATFLL